MECKLFNHFPRSRIQDGFSPPPAPLPSLHHYCEHHAPSTENWNLGPRWAGRFGYIVAICVPTLRLPPVTSRGPGPGCPSESPREPVRSRLPGSSPTQASRSRTSRGGGAQEYLGDAGATIHGLVIGPHWRRRMVLLLSMNTGDLKCLVQGSRLSDKTRTRDEGALTPRPRTLLVV